jgi:hypothetical protein
MARKVGIEITTREGTRQIQKTIHEEQKNPRPTEHNTSSTSNKDPGSHLGGGLLSAASRPRKKYPKLIWFFR